MHQPLGFDVNLEFQGLEMLLAVSAAEEPQSLIGAGPQRKPTGSQRNEPSEHGKVEVWLGVRPDLASCFLRETAPRPEAAAVQFDLPIAGLHADADFRPRAP